MAFTNVFDNTSPLQTQVANLYGKNLRDVRLDIQQRLAAISGLDASKPAFGADAQPANWNGVLFWATDSGRLYQFTNPNWNDQSVVLRNKFYKAQSIVSYNGNVGTQTVYTVTVPAGVITATTQIYITLVFQTTAGFFGNPTINFLYGGSNFAGVVMSSVVKTGLITFQGGNFGNASAQTWFQQQIFANAAAQQGWQSGGTTSTTAINSTLQQSFTVQWVSNQAGNSITFYGFLVELY